MAKALSPISIYRLKTCDPRLIALIEAVHARQPVSVLCGHRTQAEQDAAFFAKKSKVKFPGSKHNALPALAVDICPIKAFISIKKYYNKNNNLQIISYDDYEKTLK